MRSTTSVILDVLKAGRDLIAVSWELTLRDALGDCSRVLDVGCGKSRHLRLFGVPHSTGIEGHRPTFEEARRMKTHDEFVFGDVRSLDQYFKPGQFDTCMSVEVIEHLTKEEGLKMLAAMERIASKRVVITTPSGWLAQRHLETDDLQVHKSAWTPAEMEALGFRVIGVLGPKSLRGEYHMLKRRPKMFWGVVSLLGHFLYSRRKPDKAAGMICVKEKPAS